MASRAPCYCSICVLDTYEDDDGNCISGSLQTSKTRKQHEISDAKREKRTAIQAARVETEIFVTTLDSNRGQQPGFSVVRPRDTLWDQAPHEGMQEDKVRYHI